MNTETVITYQITDSLTNEQFNVTDRYQAQHYYDKGDSVAEFHTTVTHIPPFTQTLVQIATSWHDPDDGDLEFKLD